MLEDYAIIRLISESILNLPNLNYSPICKNVGINVGVNVGIIFGDKLEFLGYYDIPQTS